jgi:hypothetical protein
VAFDAFSFGIIIRVRTCNCVSEEHDHHTGLKFTNRKINYFNRKYIIYLNIFIIKYTYSNISDSASSLRNIFRVQ